MKYVLLFIFLKSLNIQAAKIISIIQKDTISGIFLYEYNIPSTVLVENDVILRAAGFINFSDSLYKEGITFFPWNVDVLHWDVNDSLFLEYDKDPLIALYSKYSNSAILNIPVSDTFCINGFVFLKSKMQMERVFIGNVELPIANVFEINSRKCIYLTIPIYVITKLLEH